MALQKTKNDIPAKTRENVCAELNVALAEALDLRLQAKQAHWNVKGPNFIALHELFDKVAEGLDVAADLIAERIAQLGGTPVGTLQGIGKASSLEPYPISIKASNDHVEKLSDAMAAYGKRVRALIDTTDELGDKDASDIMTEISRQLDLHLWFVESHLG